MPGYLLGLSDTTATPQTNILAGNFTQTAGPAYPLGLKICSLVLDGAKFSWTWCDSQNFSVATDAWTHPRRWHRLAQQPDGALKIVASAGVHRHRV